MFVKNAIEKVRKEIPVIVCTELKAVVFGYIYEDEMDNDPISIRQCRMCVYWSANMKGIMGLANMGPDKECKISPPAPIFRPKKISAVITLTPEAVKKWEAAPWAK